MINKTYARAYKEVIEIIRHFPKEEYAKIPLDKIEFYKNNMDKEYNFTVNPKINLAEQNISPEANAIIVNLYIDYFANEQQNEKIQEILQLNQKKQEQEKHGAEEIFKNNESMNKKTLENKENTLTEYKETFFSRIKKTFFKILHRNQK